MQNRNCELMITGQIWSSTVKMAKGLGRLRHFDFPTNGRWGIDEFLGKHGCEAREHPWHPLRRDFHARPPGSVGNVGKSTKKKVASFTSVKTTIKIYWNDILDTSTRKWDRNVKDQLGSVGGGSPSLPANGKSADWSWDVKDCEGSFSWTMEPSGTLPHPKFHSREKCSIRFSVMPLALLQSARSPLQSVCSCTWCAMNSLHLLPRAPSNCNAAIYLHQDCGPNWLGGIIQTNWACTRHGMARLTPSCSIPLKHEAFESEGEAELNQKRRHRRTEMCTAHEN